MGGCYQGKGCLNRGNFDEVCDFDDYLHVDYGKHLWIMVMAWYPMT